MEYVLSHDIGTSGNKACLFDRHGRLVATAFRPYDTYYPSPGWVEQDPEGWWQAVVDTTRELAEKQGLGPASIACIAFSGQMMGCLPVDESIVPLRPSIIWADQRAVEQARISEAELGQEFVYRTTGHRVSPAYSGAKIAWVKENEPRVYALAAKFLHAKDFIVARLTGQWATDFSDASGMNMFDIVARRWSPEILEALDIEEDKLPAPKGSTEIVGEVTQSAAAAMGISPGIPVVIGGGDGSCAAAGAGVTEPGSAYNYIGSSSWIGVASHEPLFDPEMRTFNWIHLDPAIYSPTGTMQAAGGSYAWMRSALCQLEQEAASRLGVSGYEIMNLEASRVPSGSDGLIYLPYLLGERSPHWNPYARGVFIGLGPSHTRAHMIRAVLEGVALNLRIILEVFRSSIEVKSMRAIGGGAKGALWRQILADVFGLPVERLAYLDEATSMGAALAGGVGVGLYPGFEMAEKMNEINHASYPEPGSSSRYDELYGIFKDSYYALIPVLQKLAAFVSDEP